MSHRRNVRWVRGNRAGIIPRHQFSSSDAVPEFVKLFVYDSPGLANV